MKKTVKLFALITSIVIMSFTMTGCLAILEAVLLGVDGDGGSYDSGGSRPAPTMDKVKFGPGAYDVQAASTSISGAVVIPEMNGNSRVTRMIVGSFSGCTRITSVDIPATMRNIYSNAFSGCENLTRVTFRASDTSCSGSSFPGDLVAKYNAGGAGTYTRQAGSNTWTKQ